MITASLYYSFYLIVVTLLSIPVISWYKSANGNCVPYRPNDNAKTMVLALLVILFVGFRPLSGGFGDTGNYYAGYCRIEGAFFFLDLNEPDPIFSNVFSWFASKKIDFTLWCAFMAAIYFGAAYVAIARMFPKNTFAAYLVFLAAFSTFSYGTNGIRAGVAASIFLLAISFHDKKLVCIPLVLVSLGVHHSMQVLVAAYVLTLFFKNAKWYYYGWLFCLLMAIGHVGFFSALFATLTDESGASYLINTDASSEDYGGVGGFRLDFVLYSAVPVVIGYYTEMKHKMKTSALYRTLMHLYLCSNGIWLLCMYATFTNRIAYLSWQLYPVLLIFPFLNEAWGKWRYRYCAIAMGYHLAFTLFMHFVFYEFLK